MKDLLFKVMFRVVAFLIHYRINNFGKPRISLKSILE